MPQSTNVFYGMDTQTEALTKQRLLDGRLLGLASARRVQDVLAHVQSRPDPGTVPPTPKAAERKAKTKKASLATNSRRKHFKRAIESDEADGTPASEEASSG